MNKEKHIKVLVTAIGSTTGYGVVKCLEGLNDIFLVGVDADKNCFCKSHVDVFSVVPKINDPGFITRIKELIDKYEIDVVIPTLHSELELFDRLREYTNVLLPSCKNYNMLLDKEKTYEELVKQGKGKLVPKRIFIDKPEMVNDALTALGYPEKSVCFKPTTGYGGLGMRIISSPKNIVQSLFTQRGGSMITSDELKRLLKEKFYPFMLVEYLNGDEYSVDYLRNKGKPICCVSRKRDKAATGVAGIIVKGRVIENLEVIEATKEVAKTLDINGFSNIQFRYGDEGIPKLIDINPRFCGSLIMSYGSGVNFPYLTIKAALGETVNPVNPNWNVAITSYWESYFYNIDD